MNIIFFAIIVTIFSFTDSFGQTKPVFFPKEKLIDVSVYYYPESWDKSQWERDIKNIASFGFEYVHLTDHAWYDLEPKEGVYNFGWVDTVINLAAKYGMKTLLSTPTSAPPVWLNENYPEILMIDENGVTMRHGTRQQYSWSSPVFRKYTEKICEAMGKHFGKNPNVIGWQIDNEPSHYGKYDYSPAVRTRFIEWLKVKYKDINTLNERWGMRFWTMHYQTFEQIRLPNEKELVQMPNPHALLDFKRFTAEECASFVSLQNTVLRKYVNQNQWITTNFMYVNGNVDPRLNKDLDLVSYTMYPVSGYSDGKGEQGFRIGNPSSINFANDFFRPITGQTGCMELQPGQVNWGIYNYQPYPGAIRMWLWHCYSSGSDYISSYRYRQPLYGMEQYHYGMVGTDGVTPTRGGLEYKKFMEEIVGLRKLYNADAKAPKEWTSKKTAFLHSYDNTWNMNQLKQTSEWASDAHNAKYYDILKSFGIPVDFITENVDFNNYPFLIAPAYQLVDKKLIARWKEYVENGGNLILTVRTGTKTKDGYFWEEKYGEPIWDLIGAKIDYYDVLSQKHKGKLSFEGKPYDWSLWGDILEPNQGTESWVTYDDQFYKGKTCVIHSKKGKGTVTYIGVDTKEFALETQLVKNAYQKAGISLTTLPESMVLNWIDGFWVAMNYASVEVDVPAPANTIFIIGSKRLKPCEVAVWK